MKPSLLSKQITRVEQVLNTLTVEIWFTLHNQLVQSVNYKHLKKLQTQHKNPAYKYNNYIELNSYY